MEDYTHSINMGDGGFYYKEFLEWVNENNIDLDSVMIVMEPEYTDEEVEEMENETCERRDGLLHPFYNDLVIRVYGNQKKE